MEKELLEEIYEARWLSWKKEIIDSNSTPLLLLSMGHGDKIGDFLISTCEEISVETIEELLVAAWWQLKTKNGGD